jgi:hypothetical protein
MTLTAVMAAVMAVALGEANKQLLHSMDCLKSLQSMHCCEAALYAGTLTRVLQHPTQTELLLLFLHACSLWVARSCCQMHCQQEQGP